MIGRRSFLGLAAAGPAIALFPASAQTARSRRIGVLSPFTLADAAPWHEAFRQGLRELGWIEGKNIHIEYRYAASPAELSALAAELVRLEVDIIVTSATGTPPAMAATQTIPIVMASNADPVQMGMVKTLAKPGGNVTGLSQISSDLAGKRLELLKEIVPNLALVAVMWNPDGIAYQEMQLPAERLGLRLHPLEARGSSDFERVFAEASRAHVGALAIMPSPLFAGNLRGIADLAIKNRLPAMFNLREFVDSGGLASYGPNRANEFYRAATYVDKILRGAKPADLPVERPTRFELMINLKTAQALGLTIPQAVLVRADDLIR